MQLEFHQLDQPFEHLRVRHPGPQRHLLASLAESGQQTPIIVVAAADQPGRHLVIDGHKRVAALRQLGRDTVEAVAWPMGCAEALVLDRSLRMGQADTALEQGWLLAELEHRYGYGLDQLARRFDRSVSWVSRRLALVELLPESIQQQVREGKVTAHLAMKYLVPVARASLEDCLRMAAAFARNHWNTRQAGQLYAAWRGGSPKMRERILEQPELFLKAHRRVEPERPPPESEELLRDLDMVLAIAGRATRRLADAAAGMDGDQRGEARRRIERARAQLGQLDRRIEKEQQQQQEQQDKDKEKDKHVEQSTADRDHGTEHTGDGQARDRADHGRVAPDGAQGTALELHRGAGNTPRREGRTAPATDPGAVERLQGEPGPGP